MSNAQFEADDIPEDSIYKELLQAVDKILTQLRTVEFKNLDIHLQSASNVANQAQFNSMKYLIKGIIVRGEAVGKMKHLSSEI